MEIISKILPFFALCVGGWAVINGVLHDIFILRSDHGKIYNRELLRLLMDGHILISSGIFQLIAYTGLRENASWAYFIAGIASLSLLVYCCMIFPFLRSYATMFLNFILLILIILKGLHIAYL